MQTRTTGTYTKIIKIVFGLCFVSAVTLSLGACPPQDGSGDYTLTCTVTPAGAGTVVVSPSKSTYESGEQVQITAQPGANYQFDRWQGGTSGQSNPLTLTINGDTTVEAVMVASGGGGGTSDTKTSSLAKMLEDDVAIQTTADGKLELSGANLPTLYPGHVIISAANGGVLARVRTVTAQDGKLILETMPASLTDVIQQGSIRLRPMMDTSPQSIARAKMLERSRQDLPADIDIEYLGDGLMKFSVGVYNFDVEMGEGSTISLKELSLAFTAGPQLDADINDFSIDYFKCAATGNVHLKLEVGAESNVMTDKLKKEITLAEKEFAPGIIPLPIGGIPYIWVIKLTMGAEMTMGDFGTVSGGFEIDTGVTAGAVYQGGNWTPIGEFHFDLTPIVPVINLTPVEVMVYAKPELGIKFAGIAGPSIAVKDYVKLVSDLQSEDLAIGAELRKGSAIDLNFELKALDFYKVSYEKNLWDSSYVMLALLAFGADPASLGDVSHSPDGIGGTNFFWYTDPVTVTTALQTGYEVVAYRIDHLCEDKTVTKTGHRLEDEPINASKQITALMVPIDPDNDPYGTSSSGEGTYTITAEVFPADAGAGDIIIYPRKTKYKKNDRVLVWAKPANDYTFHHWEGALEGDSEVMEFHVPGNTTIRAVFAALPDNPFARHLHVPSNYPTIQAALDAATYNEVIHLGFGTFSGEGNRDLNYHGRNVTLYGEGPTNTIIDLGGAYRLAEIDDIDGTIRFENLSIQNGNGGSSGGGALKLSKKVSAEFWQCTFVNCAASYYGAAIYFDYLRSGQQSPSILKFDSCTFDGCSGTSAIYARVNGYGVTGLITLDGCTFTNNAKGCFSCPEINGQIHITNNCQFTSNQGTCIDISRISELATIDRCVFTNNSTGLTSTGAAIKCGDNTLIQNCTFTGNTATNYGGAVVTVEPVKPDGRVTIEDCVFTNNSAPSSGGIHLGKRCVMRRCAFTGNRATHGEGGGAYVAGSASNCTFTGNYAWSEGGAAEIAYDGVIEGSTFTENSSDLWGGAVFLYYGGTISGGTIENNTAKGAGAVFGRGTVRNVVINNNRTTERHNGGALDVTDSEIINCTITNNQAILSGGGIDAHKCLITGCTISGNSAVELGGGIYTLESTITNCTITNNTAAEGGGIWANNDDNVIYNCVFLDNTPENCFDEQGDACWGYD